MFSLLTQIAQNAQLVNNHLQSLPPAITTVCPFLTDDENLSHTSLLIRDYGGQWHYFYWGANPETAEVSFQAGTCYVHCEVNGPVALAINAISNQPGNGVLIYEHITFDYYPDDDRKTLASINTYLDVNGLYDYKYDRMIYFELPTILSGSAHLRALYLERKQAELTYNLFTNNCAQMCLDVTCLPLSRDDKYLRIYDIETGSVYETDVLQSSSMQFVSHNGFLYYTDKTGLHRYTYHTHVDDVIYRAEGINSSTNFIIYDNSVYILYVPDTYVSVLDLETMGITTISIPVYPEYAAIANDTLYIYERNHTGGIAEIDLNTLEVQVWLLD